jgi:alkylation response protein AidB-like acyl-CoA dehydrogenase
MTATVPVTDPSPGTTPLDAVLELVARRRDEFTRLVHVPQDVVDGFKRAGIFRAATPARFGGDALPPAEFLRRIERIAIADGSAGWVASFGSAGGYLAALPVETQAELYADGPDLVFAGGIFPLQPAEPVDGGYRIRGRWPFASGCRCADAIGVGIRIEQNDGRPWTAVLHPDQVEIVENWDVVGLVGTGSHDVVVGGAVVPRERVFLRGGAPTVDDPLFRYPSLAYAAQVLAVVGLGVGRAALDHAAETGAGHRSITGAPVPADRPYFRISLAKAEAHLRSARAFFYEITEQAWETVLAGDPATPTQVALLRMAASHAARAGAAATRAAFELCGISAIQNANPMQRYLRDAAVVTQHAFLAESMYDGAGAVLTGRDPFPGFL